MPEQSHFDFDTPGSEDGFRAWEAELAEYRLAFERKWGVVLRRRVEVTLHTLSRPLVGMLKVVRTPHKGAVSGAVYAVGKVQFLWDEIVSIVQIEEQK